MASSCISPFGHRGRQPSGHDNMIYGYGPALGRSYDGRGFPGLTVAYFRLAWSHLEPQGGRFNWSILDTPIQRYVSGGKKIAFCFTVFEGSDEQETPLWLRAAGAQGKLVEVEKASVWEPDYDDPVLLAKLEKPLLAAGRRYGDSPNLVFVDVGTLGIWREEMGRNAIASASCH